MQASLAVFTSPSGHTGTPLDRSPRYARPVRYRLSHYINRTLWMFQVVDADADRFPHGLEDNT